MSTFDSGPSTPRPVRRRRRPSPKPPRPAWLLSLSPRLARAGLVFIVFGFAAALLPEQYQSVLADNNCTIKTHVFKITNPGGTAANSYTQGTNSTVKYTSYYDTTQEGKISVQSNTGNATVTGDGTSQVSVAVPNNGHVTDGTLTLTATDTNSGTAYNISVTISY